MVFKRKAVIKRKAVYKKRVYKKRAPKASSSLVKTIKRVMQKQEETKCSSYSNLNWFMSPKSTSIDMNVQTLSPSSYVINQGVGQGDRIGNKIATKRCILRLVAFPLPYNITTNGTPIPQDIVIYFGKLKQTLDSPTSTDFTQLYQAGNSSAAPVNSLIDLTKPINTDIFTVVKQIRFKLGYSVYAGTGVNVGNQSFSNNDYKLNFVRNIDITKLMAKHYIFSDNTNPPVNSALFMWNQSVGANGTTAAANVIPASCSYTIDYQYTDA